MGGAARETTRMRRLAAPVALASLLAAGSAAFAAGAAHQYVGARKCRTCHGKELIGDQYGVWLRDPHRRAFETLKSAESARIASERKLARPAHEADECLRCHVTAHGVPAVARAYELDPAEGVQCESCHGPGRDYRRKSLMSDVEKARARGLWDAGGDAAICTACHNPESPTFDARRYRLPGGGTAGFDFEQAKARIAHPIPEDVKGRYVEREKELKAAGLAVE
jgi:hypothetical protein